MADETWLIKWQPRCTVHARPQAENRQTGRKRKRMAAVVSNTWKTKKDSSVILNLTAQTFFKRLYFQLFPFEMMHGAAVATKREGAWRKNVGEKKGKTFDFLNTEVCILPSFFHFSFLLQVITVDISFLGSFCAEEVQKIKVASKTTFASSRKYFCEEDSQKMRPWLEQGWGNGFLFVSVNNNSFRSQPWTEMKTFVFGVFVWHGCQDRVPCAS